MSWQKYKHSRLAMSASLLAAVFALQGLTKPGGTLRVLCAGALVVGIVLMHTILRIVTIVIRGISHVLGLAFTLMALPFIWTYMLVDHLFLMGWFVWSVLFYDQEGRK